MSTSETVQAAQRLQITGTLVQMGGEQVPRLQIECDDGTIVEVANVAQALLAAMPPLLYKRVTLTVAAERQPGPGPLDSDPSEAERNMRAKEDADRAAYLARWANAPAEATHLTEDVDGSCVWRSIEASLSADGQCWGGGWITYAGHNILGRVACEPRPGAEGER
jgi:hypothetical protein